MGSRMSLHTSAAPCKAPACSCHNRAPVTQHTTDHKHGTPTKSANARDLNQQDVSEPQLSACSASLETYHAMLVPVREPHCCIVYVHAKCQTAMSCIRSSRRSRLCYHMTKPSWPAAQPPLASCTCVTHSVGLKDPAGVQSGSL
jgi:hypothetical protein